jgi:anaerobic magnesium-protoporphyrin IX monomethyl ester cyclase
MKIKKILLITPPAYTFKSARDINPLPPMGLGYLASIVRNIDIEVKILDCLVRGWNHEEELDNKLIRVGLSDIEIENYISEFNPDLVGINCQFSRQHKIYHKILSLIKKTKPECITIAGGAHATVCPEDVLGNPFCDFILLGEAEESFKDFILKLNQNLDITSVDGLGWKSNGNININKKMKWITNLDTIPFPAYDIMEIEKYSGLEASHGLRHKDRFCPIITSRGCPAKCAFCSAHKVWGNKYRSRSVDNVLEEMRLLKNKYNIEELLFEDDNATANPKLAKELFSRMVREKYNFVWDTPNGVGVWSMDEEMIDLMKQSGCIKLNFPVESGSQHVLNAIIKKPLNLDKVKTLINYCKKIDLDYGMFLVIGLPGEKLSDIWQSFRFAAECGCYTPHISIATPYPGTELLSICKEKKYFARDFTLDNLFIRSFSIRTPDWNEYELKKILLKGNLYLKWRNFLAYPYSDLKRYTKKLKHPFKMMSSIKNIFTSVV